MNLVLAKLDVAAAAAQLAGEQLQLLLTKPIASLEISRVGLGVGEPGKGFNDTLPIVAIPRIGGRECLDGGQSSA